MPSKTPRQARLMAMCATPEGRAKAKKKCPSHQVAKEYHEADLKNPMSGLKKPQRASRKRKR